MHRRMWWRSGTVLLVTCVALALVQPTPVDAARKKVLHFAAREPAILDPHVSIFGQVQAIVRFVYRGLTRFTIKDGKVTTAEVEPALAESWTMSAYSTEWILKLCKDVQFHKGFGEMTAGRREVQLRAPEQAPQGPAVAHRAASPAARQNHIL